MDKENKRFRVLDGFAMSKFALLPDEAYGGKQSFEQVAAGINATDGSAVVVIRRKLRGMQADILTLCKFYFQLATIRIYRSRTQIVQCT